MLNDLKNRIRIKRQKIFPKSVERLFEDIYRKNIWGSPETVSGSGSELEKTKKVVEDIATIIENYSISTILDIPCGDFNWMKKIDFSAIGVDYLGCDIIKDLINKNKLFENERVKFEVGNIISDDLIRSDLIICRDCFVHFSFSDIRKSLLNIINSRSQYLLLTSFIKTDMNTDIVTGLGWRPLNFEIEPFYFPEPSGVFIEKFSSENWRDSKSLLLYKINKLKTPYLQGSI
jgi:hypothetical protein